VYAVYFTALVLVGMVLVRHEPLRFRTAWPFVASLSVVTAAGSALLLWRRMLFAGLSEAAEMPPLPVPLDFVVETLGIVLLTSGPLAGGALLMLACREAERGSRMRALIYVCCLWYAAHWAPRIAASAP